MQEEPQAGVDKMPSNPTVKDQRQNNNVHPRKRQRVACKKVNAIPGEGDNYKEDDGS
jgi:hypothetical protein